MFVYVSSNWSEKPTTSKSRSGRALSSDTSGSPRARSSRLHVDPRRVAALGERARVVVQDLVEDLEAEVAHPDVVDVGEREADARLDRGPVLRARAELAAEVARGLLHQVDERRVRMFSERRHGRDGLLEAGDSSSPGRASALDAMAMPWPTPMQSAAMPRFAPRAFIGVEQRAEDARAARADRVAERDRAAVDVDARGVELEPADARERLRGERLVQLDEIEVVDASSRRARAPSSRRGSALRP